MIDKEKPGVVPAIVFIRVFDALVAYSNIEYGTSKIGVVSNKQSINKTVSFLKQHANSPRAVVLSIHTYGYFYGVAIINSYNNSEFSFTLTPVEIGNGNGQWNVHWIALW